MVRIAVVLLVLASLTSLLALPRTAAQTTPTLDDRVASLETRVAFLEATWGMPVTLTPTAAPQPATATLTATLEPAPTVTPVPTVTVVPSATPTTSNTPSPVPSPTEEPTATVTVVPTPTSAPPTSTPAPIAGQECPAWVHARHTALGPDGRTYPTWHPQIDGEFGCFYAHEHGDDPRLSRANPALPAFGYIGLLIGDDEPHAGFKVFVQNAGSVNDDGRTLAHDARMVVHMGTAGPKRFVARFHSLMYDFIARDGSGHEAHVMGMADTGTAGSICQDRQAFTKTVMVLPGLCATTSPYEIWTTRMDIGGRFEVNSSWGVFDPITIMDPADPTRTLLMGDYYPSYGHGYGCKREGYSGPNYYDNGTGGGLATFRTDAYGVPRADGPIVQTVSRHSGTGVRSMYVVRNSSDVQTQAKYASYRCVAGLRSPN